MVAVVHQGIVVAGQKLMSQTVTDVVLHLLLILVSVASA